MAIRKLRPIHPGEVLAFEFLEPSKISQYRLAQDISVPPRRINEIVHGKRGVSADTALRLARYFGTSERFWLNLQVRFDLETQRDELGRRLEKEVRVLAQPRRPIRKSLTARLNQVYGSRQSRPDPPLRVAERRPTKSSG